jgi:hypothetical protein
VTAKPLTVALPPGIDLSSGCTVRVTALDPNTGAEVTTVNISNITLEVDSTGGGDLTFGPFVPLLRSV